MKTRSLSFCIGLESFYFITRFDLQSNIRLRLTDLLTAGVLDNLRKVTAYAQKHEARFVKLLIQQNEMGGKRKLAAAAKQLEQVQSRIAELSRYIKRLYEDNVNGKISGGTKRRQNISMELR